jgi:hypothetical protein
LRDVAILGAVVAASLVAAPSAASDPICDRTTPEGTLACLGGGPWQQPGDPDTYGPTGVPAFLKENRASFPRMDDQNLLKLGQTICKGHAQGMSDDSLQSILMSHGTDENTAGAVVMSAQMWLCPAA